MSAPKRSAQDCTPFVLFSTPADSVMGTDVFFNAPDGFNFSPPPYQITAADVAPTPGCPLLTVYPTEHGLSTTQTSVQSWPPFYFLTHPAICQLLPSVRVPEIVQHAYELILCSKAQTILLAGLFRLVSAVAWVLPKCVQAGWTAFLPSDKPATSPTWDTYPSVNVGWLFPGTEEFPEDQPLHDCLSIDDHTTLLRIARPSLRVFTSFLTGGCIRESGGPELAVQLLNEAIDPQCNVFELLADDFRAGRLSPEAAH
ncbi:hypothetical protein DFH08DRAFT_978260 [Mycena albidolilacea]|uniref:Uncharacterized protein n=1 Tax=Mycena albidolilacea TaxID=1033008 RepID=A0AAD6YZD2_9AGAR|nr:hypothetical protein DFH08DRAFT_978260 [Mycena albidolilacea]